MGAAHFFGQVFSNVCKPDLWALLVEGHCIAVVFFQQSYADQHILVGKSLFLHFTAGRLCRMRLRCRQGPILCFLALARYPAAVQKFQHALAYRRPDVKLLGVARAKYYRGPAIRASRRRSCTHAADGYIVCLMIHLL